MTLFVGERQNFCTARATYRDGQTEIVGLKAAWSVANPAVASAGKITLPNGFDEVAVTGLSPGQTVISASYSGYSSSQAVSVIAEDYLRFGAGSYQGEARPGTLMTMTATGSYFVSPAELGKLSFSILDQTGGLVVTTSIVTTPGNYNPFLFTVTFTVPPGSTRLCETVVLEIGVKTLSQSPTNLCVPIQP